MARIVDEAQQDVREGKGLRLKSASLHLGLGNLEACRKGLDEVLAHAVRENDGVVLQACHTRRAACELRAGNLDWAASYLEKALQLLPKQTEGIRRCETYWVAARLAAARGEREKSEAWSEQIEKEFLGIEEETRVDPGPWTLSAFSKILQREGDLHGVLKDVLEMLAQATGADSAVLFLADREGSMIPQHVWGGALAGYSKGVLQRALSEGKVVVVEDARSDSVLKGQASIQDLGVGPVFCVPMFLDAKPVAMFYLHKSEGRPPFTPDQVQLTHGIYKKIEPLLRREWRLADQTSQIDDLKRLVRGGLTELSHRYSFGQMLGRSPAMQKIFDDLERLAGVDYPAVIEGETGTGKELAAKAIHFNSARKEHPFIAVNCAAVTETLLDSELFGHARGAFTGAEQARKGLFELANGGTLFLDEVEEMAPSMQKKLLRVLEEGKIRPVGAHEEVQVNVRILGATNQSLKALVREGKFREDLYYRIAALTVTLPPLSERGGDIADLARRFMEEACRENGVSNRQFGPGALEALVQYRWPGNVRELRNEIRRLVTFAPERIDKMHLHPSIVHAELTFPQEGSYQERLDSLDKQLILESLKAQGGSVRATAKALGLARNTLLKKIRQYGVDPQLFKD